MKTSRIILALAIALVSCNKEVTPIQNTNEKAVNFIAQSIETKTAFGEKDGNSYPTLWTENDSKVKISLNFATGKDASVTPSSDFKSASFNASFQDDKSGSYTFYSVSPSSASLSVSKDYKSFTIVIPTAQTPTSKSVDEAAQILIAKSTSFNSWPSKVSFDYSHVTAYGKMSLTNLNLAGATINSISLTAAENWAGRWFYYFDKPIEPNSASSTISITTSSDTDIWFACAPVDLSGKKITVIVNTTAGTFEKEITWPADKPFTSGKVYKFAVDMSGISPAGTKTYTKVTDISSITVDSELIIAADDYDTAMSTTQNSNNRAEAAIVKSEDKKTIDNPGPDVQIFKAKKGSKTNTLAFYTGSGYIFAASSSKNYLRTQETLDDNASFSLSITGGVALLTAQGTNTRNIIQYNDGSTIFSCYESASQKKVCIYKLNGSGTQTPIFQAVPKHTLTISSCQNGTVTAKVNGEAVESGVQIEEGTKIAITATPDSDYDFDSWSITGATAEDSEQSTTNITVGSEDITISATFKKNESGEKTVDIIAAAGLKTSVTLNDSNKQYTMGDSGIKLTGTKGTSNFPALNYNSTKGTDLRFYKGTSCSVTFETANEKAITKIEFLKDSSTAATLGSSFSVDTGTLSGNVWTGNAKSVKITYSNSETYKEQMYIIKVTYLTK